MENQSNRGVTIAIVTGVVALLLGLCGGAIVGGIAGYVVGREAGAGALGPQGGPANPFDFGGPQGQAPQFPAPQADQGVTVQDVVAGSPAAQGGIQPGDIIVQVDEVRIDSGHPLGEVIAGHKPGDRVRIVLQRFGTEHMANVRLGEQSTQPGKAFLGVRYSQQAPEPDATPTP